MSEAVRLMEPDAFLDWCTSQEERYELVGGVPVAMAGAKRGHDRIVMNTTLAVGNQSRGSPCQPFSADFAVRIPGGNIRRPDIGIDCGPFVPDDLAATDPRVVIEVLSPSTRTFDMIGKLREYQRVPSLRHIILIDPEEPRVLHWSRDPDGRWSDHAAEGLDAVIALTDPTLTLSLADLYEGLTFRPRPRPLAETLA